MAAATASPVAAGSPFNAWVEAPSESSWQRIGGSDGGDETSPAQQPIQLLSLSYPQCSSISLDKPIQLHVGSYTELPPQVVGAASAVFSVTPALPEGLVLGETSGVISGVPSYTTAVQTYMVTAANEGVEVSAQVVLAVAAAKIYAVAGSRKSGNTTQTWLPGLQQKLSAPCSLCSHRGQLYIGQDASIAEMDLQTGKVKLLLGTPGSKGNEGDGKEKEFAKVGEIKGTVVYEEELYFADCTHHVVRKVGLPGSKAPGLVCRVAGTGSEGVSGNGCPAVAAELKCPWGLAIVNGGKLLIADYNHRIRAVDLESGVIITVAGTPMHSGFAGDGGPALQAKLSCPRGLLVVGQMAYVADSHNHRIRSIDLQQNPPKIATVAGGGQKSANGASARDWQLSYPTSLSLGLDGKMYVTSCFQVVAIDLQEPHYPTSLVAGTGVQDKGTDFIAATSSALSSPSAVAAVGEGAVYIAEQHCIRRVAASAVKRLSGSGAVAMPVPAELMDKMSFLGAWRTLTSDGALASPFCLPAGSAYMSPTLPQDCKAFCFSLDLIGSDFPPTVLGVAAKPSIELAAANLKTDGRLPASDFYGAALMLAPLPGLSRQCHIVRYAAGMSPTQVMQASTEVMKLFLRDKIAITGSVSRKELGDGSYEYTLKDVLLNGVPAAMPSFNSMTAPCVGADVAMHVFIAAWEPSSNQLQIIVESPPCLERSSTS